MDESCIYWREVVHRRRQGCEDGGKPQGAAEYLVPFHVFLHVFDGPHPAPGEARGERAETCGRWGVRPMLSRWKKTVLEKILRVGQIRDYVCKIINKKKKIVRARTLKYLSVKAFLKRLTESRAFRDLN